MGRFPDRRVRLGRRLLWAVGVSADSACGSRMADIHHFGGDHHAFPRRRGARHLPAGSTSPVRHRRRDAGGRRARGGGLGVVAWANVRAPWQLFAAALLSGTGWAATSGAALNAMVAPWFHQDRPKALSLAFNGSSVGGLILTPVWVALIARLGFASAAAVIGATMVVVLCPVIAGFLRPRPAAAGSALPGAGRNAARSGLRRAELLRGRRFITISAAFALGLFAQVGLFAHLVTRLDPELGSSAAAWAISLAAGCAGAGRVIFGWPIGRP